MSRLVNLAAVTVVLAATAVAGAGIGSAGPGDPPPPCAYTLSPPQVVQADGGSRVMATVTPSGCAGAFRPALSVACVYIDGQDSQGQCTQAQGPGTAEVHFEPYQPGATYRSTGRGCGTLFWDALAPNCQVLGPIHATL
jgi:hypothetical protein